MKTRQLFAIIFALTMAWMTSCTDKDSVTGSGMEGTQTFTFNVTTEGQAQTRATATNPPTVSGFKMQYILQVLNADGSTLDLGSGKTQETNTTGRFAVKLQVGKEYTCLFWAQYIADSAGDTDQSEFFTTTDLKAVTLKKPLTEGDQCQAFSATAEIPAAPTNADIKVTLVRAVAQVNQKSSVKMENYSKVGITYSDVPNVFNVLDRTVAVTPGTNDAATFTATSFANGADAAGAYPFHSAYVLASGDGNANMLKVKLEVYNTASSSVPIQSPAIDNVPTKKNFRTNVINTFASATAKHTYTFSYDEWGGDQNLVMESKWDGTTPAPDAGYAFGDGSGDGSTAEKAYIIADAADFAQLMANVNGGTDYDGKFFELTTDINLDNNNWTPIGTDANPFKGIFDGSMHTIFNLKVNSNEEYVGLFGRMQGDASFISNLHVRGDVRNTNNDSGSKTGGIIGYSSSGNYIKDIENCSFEGTVIALKGFAGGIVGGMYGGEVRNCKNSGTVSGEVSTGGIIGDGSGDNIYDCYNTGTVTGQKNAGGIAGELGHMFIRYCYNIGAISSSDPTKIGALSCSLNCDMGALFACYCKEKYSVTDAGANETVFANGAWPQTSGEAWKVDSSGTGADGNWKSLGGWNSGGNTIEYPKLWWEE